MTELGVRVGLDLGGTKIAGIALGPDDSVLAEQRMPAPRGNYEATVVSLSDLVQDLARAAEVTSVSIGIGMPGSVQPVTGRVQNANSTWLNGRRLEQDLESVLGQPVRLANDANCFALSEARDGAAAGAASMFGVILGTGCGGALVHRGSLLDGPLGIGGEWGHNPLPWMEPEEFPGPTCWCGRKGCLETFISGTGLTADHERATGECLTGEEIVGTARLGVDLARDCATADSARALAARATLERHASRLARGLAHVVNLFDPHVIVLGGGLSQLSHLYAQVPELMRSYIFSDLPHVDLRAPRWGDASGVRGAARLWDAGG